MRIILLALCFTTSILSGCANELPGIAASEITPSDESKVKLQLSMMPMEELSSDEYLAFNVNVKNNSDVWARLDKINIAFPDLSQQPEILLGGDLISYFNSMERRSKIQNHNKGVAIASLYLLGIAGAAAGLNSGSSNATLAGLGLSQAAITYGAVDGALESARKAEFQGSLPDQHLLKPFDVAPGLSTSRWIIVKLKSEQKKAQARIELTEKGQEKRVFIVDPKLH